MTLLRPDYAWLFALLPLAGLGLYGRWRRRRRLTRLAAMPRPTGRIVRDAGFLLGLGLVMLAAAGPGIGQGPATGTETPGRLVVALDCSKSMWARDIAPDRLTAAKRLVREVLAALPDVPTGLVLFAGRARLICPITRDRAGLLLFLGTASPADMPVGGTNPTAALEAGRLALAGDKAGAVLFLSDGEGTVATDDAPQTGAPVLAVAVGGRRPAAVPDGHGGLLRQGSQPVRVGVDMAGLTALAEASGGRVYPLSPNAPSPAPALVKSLARRLGHRSERPGGALRPVDRTIPCLALGLLLLVGELADVRRGKAALALLVLMGLTWPSAPARATTAASLVAGGLDALADGRYEAARELFLAARVRQPDAPAILFDLGAAAYRLGQFDRAFRDFGRVARAATGRLREQALYNQGNAAYRLGRTAQAMALYRAALALLPDDADARANLEFLRIRQQRVADAAKAPDRAGSAATGQATRPGQASANQGRDSVKGREADAPRPPQPSPGASDHASGQEKNAGVRRTQPDAKPGDALFQKVPDLPGLPLAVPVYGRPDVEKDW